MQGVTCGISQGGASAVPTHKELQCSGTLLGREQVGAPRLPAAKGRNMWGGFAAAMAQSLAGTPLQQLCQSASQVLMCYIRGAHRGDISVHSAKTRTVAGMCSGCRSCTIEAELVAKGAVLSKKSQPPELMLRLTCRVHGYGVVIGARSTNGCL